METTKATEQFTETIRLYLRAQCRADADFLAKCRQPNKSLAECIDYILSCVMQSGCCGFADEEIFSMAKHYFDEPNLTFKKPSECHIVTNHVVELTEEEKSQAKREAISLYQERLIAEMRQPKKATAPTTKQPNTPTLELF